MREHAEYRHRHYAVACSHARFPHPSDSMESGESLQIFTVL